VAVIDTVAPAITALGFDSVLTSASSGLSIYGLYTGTLTTGEKIQVSLDGGATWADVTLPDSPGYWEYVNTTTYLEGTSFDCRVRAIDAAENVSSATAGKTIVMDYTAPAAPVISTVAGNDVVNVTEAAAGVTISGIAEAGTTISLFMGSIRQTGIAVADSGNWSYNVTATQLAAISDSSTSISVYCYDAGGNSSSATKSITLDRTAPTVTSATINGDTLTLTYSETLDPAHQPSISYGQLLVNGIPRSLLNMAVSGSTVQYTLADPVVSIDVVTFSYTDPSGGNDLAAIQDTAGNDAAGLGGQAVTNNTGSNTTAPTLTSAIFSEIANGTVTLLFNEAMAMENTNAMTLHKNCEDSILTGIASISGGAVTFSTNATLSGTDYVWASYRPNGNGYLNSVDGDHMNWLTAVIGGSGVTTIDRSEDHWSGSTRFFGNGGDDTLIGSGSDDLLVGGEGADILSGSWGVDRIDLTEATPASDTVGVGNGDESACSRPYNYDMVQGFDVSRVGGVNNDRLNLPSNTIAADTVGLVDGTDAGTLAQHRITGGILTFTDSSGNAILIDDYSSFNNAISYLEYNFTNAAGQTVAFQTDMDGNGAADSLFVFQESGDDDIYEDVLIELDGVTGVTLGASPGQNVVQLLDTTGPHVRSGSLTAVGLTLHYNELIESADFSGLILEQGNGSTRTAMLSPETSIAGNAVTITTGNTLGAEDYVLITQPLADGHQYATDSAGNSADLFGSNEFDSQVGIALGGSGDTSIDLSSITGAYSLVGGDGNDTLTGTAGDNEIDGDAGNDILRGGDGNDSLWGGSGADHLHGGDGADEYEFEQGDSTSVSFNTTTHVYTFAGGADVITGGFTIGIDGNNNGDRNDVDRLYIEAGLPGGRMEKMAVPNDGLVTDQHFFLERGDLNDAFNAFTVNNAGADTLVVYDGDCTASISQTALVLQDIYPTQLTTTDWSDIYLTNSVIG